MERLIVPVYLNQKFVFDLLAMLQGGISTVTTVTESSATTRSEDEKVSAGFGLREVANKSLLLRQSAMQPSQR